MSLTTKQIALQGQRSIEIKSSHTDLAPKLYPQQKAVVTSVPKRATQAQQGREKTKAKPAKPGALPKAKPAFASGVVPAKATQATSKSR